MHAPTPVADDTFADIDTDPPKVRITRVSDGEGRSPRPVGLLNAAAIRHFAEHGCEWVKLRKGKPEVYPRLVLLEGHLEHVPGALHIRRNRTISGKVIRRIAPPGTDILLEPRGDDLVGELPADVKLPVEPW